LSNFSNSNKSLPRILSFANQKFTPNIRIFQQILSLHNLSQIPTFKLHNPQTSQNPITTFKSNSPNFTLLLLDSPSAHSNQSGANTEEEEERFGNAPLIRPSLSEQNSCRRRHLAPPNFLKIGFCAGDVMARGALHFRDCLSTGVWVFI
jgi:hypothetical protein